MPKKHPIIAAIEERIETRAADLEQIETEIQMLNEKRDTLTLLQAEDKRLLAASTPKKPRTKKEAAKDVGQILETA